MSSTLNTDEPRQLNILLEEMGFMLQTLILMFPDLLI